MNNRQNSNSIAGVGLVPRALQLDFEKEEKKIQQFEATNKKFYKDVKNYIEKIDDLIKNENKLIGNLSNLAFISTANSNAQPSMASASSTQLPNSDSNDNESNFMEKLKTLKELSHDHIKSSETLKQTCQSHVIEPMKNLNTLFPLVYAAIKKRESSYKDLIKVQEKLEKAQEKERTGPNLVKINELTIAVQNAKQQFQRENNFLMEELPKVYNARIEYVQPCVSSLINSQLNFYSEYSKFYDKILDESEFNNKSLDDDKQLERVNDEIKQCLNDIKSLSIVSGD